MVVGCTAFDRQFGGNFRGGEDWVGGVFEDREEVLIGDRGSASAAAAGHSVVLLCVWLITVPTAVLLTGVQ